MLARLASLAPPARAALVALITATAATVATATSTASATADAAARYDAARDQYEIGHFAVAFEEFAALADRGHCDAARIARQMVRYGRVLYAIPFAVEPARLEQWQRLDGCRAVAASTR